MSGTIHSMRWFGHKDVVTLADIKQAGCEGVVSALHQYKPGDIWPLHEITEYKNYISSHDLEWNVVESLPVHDHIKLGYPDRDILIDNYIQSLKNLSDAGVYIVTYNFMPLLDWLRTDVSFKNQDGSEILYFKKIDYQIFDLFILERSGAANDYSANELDYLTNYYQSLTQEYIEILKNNILLALPGTTDNFTLDHIKEKIKEYSKVTSAQMKSNLSYFLNRICPVADQLNIKLAIHPDDPPYSVFGLSRIVSTQQDCRDLLESAPYKSNGLCFCTGSFGARPDNDIKSMISEFGHKIHFLHLRNTKLETDGNFYEANHLEGDTDMFYLFSEVLKVMDITKFRIPMRPDHGAKMLDDLRNNKKSYPGYSAIGRLKGLAELRGLEYALLRAGLT